MTHVHVSHADMYHGVFYVYHTCIMMWTAMDRVRADSSEIWGDRDGEGGGSRRKGGRADGDGERG